MARDCLYPADGTVLALDILDRDAVKRLLGLAGEVVARVPTFTLDTQGFRPRCELVAGIERHCRRRRRFVGRLSST
jgi:hypothetical protein